MAGASGAVFGPSGSVEGASGSVFDGSGSVAGWTGATPAGSGFGSVITTLLVLVGSRGGVFRILLGNDQKQEQ